MTVFGIVGPRGTLLTAFNPSRRKHHDVKVFASMSLELTSLGQRRRQRRQSLIHRLSTAAIPLSISPAVKSVEQNRSVSAKPRRAAKALLP